MYKIYINEVQCLLIASADLQNFPHKDEKDTLIGAYMGKSKHLLNYIDMCEKNPKYTRVIIHFSDYLKLYEDFISIFKIQEAAGGLIKNEKDEYLFIFRRDYWDLPKGKIEKGETEKEAAIREVEEETGIKNVSLGDKITTTYHAFKSKSMNRIIKVSHWYLMEAKNQELTPQTEEDIDKVVWMKMDDFKNNCKPVYKNILEIIDFIK